MPQPSQGTDGSLSQNTKLNEKLSETKSGNKSRKINRSRYYNPIKNESSSYLENNLANWDKQAELQKQAVIQSKDWVKINNVQKSVDHNSNTNPQSDTHFIQYNIPVNYMCDKDQIQFINDQEVERQNLLKHQEEMNRKCMNNIVEYNNYMQTSDQTQVRSTDQNPVVYDT